MVSATIFETKTKLSELIRRAQAGEEVIITSGREKIPVARLSAIERVKPRRLGFLELPGFERRRRMKILLDTHALIWAGATPGRLSRRAAEALDDTDNEVLVSAASAWEIATKVRLGRLVEAVLLEGDFVTRVAAAGYLFREITVTDALRAGRLFGVHQDPFDRMIAAQALADDIPVISVDAKLDAFGVRRIW
jgi:PIN domain nuclease of toxin-antitoxin system